MERGTGRGEKSQKGTGRKDVRGGESQEADAGAAEREREPEVDGERKGERGPRTRHDRGGGHGRAPQPSGLERMAAVAARGAWETPTAAGVGWDFLGRRRFSWAEAAVLPGAGGSPEG